MKIQVARLVGDAGVPQELDVEIAERLHLDGHLTRRGLQKVVDREVTEAVVANDERLKRGRVGARFVGCSDRAARRRDYRPPALDERAATDRGGERQAAQSPDDLVGRTR